MTLVAGVTAGQLFAPVPGGIGTYVAALTRHLPAIAAADDGAVRWIVGRHTEAELAGVGLDAAATRMLRLPERLAAPAWVGLRFPPLPARVAAELDVVHATSAAIPPASGKPLVATVHDLAFRRFPELYPARGRGFHERATRIAVAEAARILVPSRATARDLAELYQVEPGRVVVTPLGVEPVAPDRPGAARLLGDLGVDGPFVLTVGTIEPRKNLPRLLAAFAAAGDELAGHWLVVAGPSGWGPSLPEPAGASRIRLAGYVGEPVLRGLYEAASCFAYPSLYEGFGLPVATAMAHGTPVLTSDRSSLPEVAGDAAVLVDPTDEAAIAAGLVALITDDELRAKLAAAGAARAARFTWPGTAAATWIAYREVGRRGPGNPRRGPGNPKGVPR